MTSVNLRWPKTDRPLSDTGAKSFLFGPQQVLCKTLAYHDFNDLADWLLSELERSVFVTATHNLLSARGFVVSSTLCVPRRLSPLRLICSRFPAYDTSTFDATYKLQGWLDTLECGHQVYVFNYGVALPQLPPEGGAKRHRCAECAALAGEKKPVQSVRIAAEKEEGAA